MIFRHYEYKYGIHLNSNIEVGKGLFIVHGDGVYLNCSKIGENVTIYQNVTCGSQLVKGGIPELKDGVTICTGAVVVGDIVVGENSIIAANSYVSKDVAPKTLVGGMPAKVLKNLYE